jgi:3-phosphoshikimate 1-carboxyvinyltransferase
MIKIHPSGKELVIKAPPSKSIFHRELIVNYILGARGGYLDVCDGDSNDIRATKDCLKAIDAVTGSEDIVLPVQESGSTLRFMIPVALALTGGRNRLLFKTEGRLIQRPLEELSDCLAEHGITISKDMSSSVVTVEGHLTPGRYVIDGSVSSQYISGLLMALSLFDEPSSVEVTGRMSSVHYIELTTGVLAKYGVDVSLADTTYTVPGRPQGLELTGGFEVEGDWSNGAFLLCLGSLKNEGVKVEGLNAGSLQGDRKITEFLAGLNIDIADNSGILGTVRDGHSVPEITMQCDDIPDIVPYMAVTGAFYAGRTVLKGTSRLRIKESDRVKAVTDMLISCGIRAESDEDSITVYGIDPANVPGTIELTSSGDHRMAMCAVLLAEGLGREIAIDDITCLDKSFPAFREKVEREMML